MIKGSRSFEEQDPARLADLLDRFHGREPRQAVEVRPVQDA